MNPNKPIPFDFESKLDLEKTINWIKPTCNYSILLVIFYLVGIFWGESYMRNKAPWNVRPFLVVWNIFLAVFSLMGAARLWPSFVYIVREYGWYDTVCIRDHFYTDQVSGFWVLAFSVSKIVELVDTAFLVVRKKPVTFLHYFHHATTAFIYWFFVPDVPSFMRYFACINYTVHAVMYTYFAVTSMNIRFPRPVAMFITTFQISQMFVNSFVAFCASVAMLRGIRCDVTSLNLLFAISFFPFYIYQFTKFFYGAYLNKAAAKKFNETISGKNGADERDKKTT